MKTLQSVWNEMNDVLGVFGTVVIAGGAVRDSLISRVPKDYDIFILNTTGHISSFTEVRDDVRMALEKAKYTKVDIKFEWHKSEPFLIESVQTPYGEVQIMAKNIQTQEQLIDDFDWNVSRFSYGFNGYVNGEDVNNIGHGKDLVLHKVTYPYSTLRRGFRFSERFGMRFKREDVRKLCDVIRQKHVNTTTTTEEPVFDVVRAWENL